jgi:uroporphyrinogen decarboxylase
MKPRERVEAALLFEETDRPPFQATFVPEMADRLRLELGIEGAPPYDPHHGRWSGYDLEIATHQDALQCSIGWVTSYYQEDEPFVDEWGVEWRIKSYETPFGPGSYTELRRGPLEEDGAIESYRPPDPNRPELYENLARLIEEYGHEYYVIGRLHCTIFETAWALRGLDRMMVDLVADPGLAERILEIPYQYHRVVAHKMAGMGVDMIWLGDDVSGQENMLMSPRTWEQMLKPRMATLIAEVKEIAPGIKVAYHCDGNVTKIVPQLVEIGVDVLNPVQAESVDPVRLKREFGDRLCFFGGVDVQSTLPFGAPDDVMAEVLERLCTLGRGGGWICAPTHHVQLDTPMENFLALVDAVAEAHPGLCGEETERFWRVDGEFRRVDERKEAVQIASGVAPIYEAVLAGDGAGAEAGVASALEAGVPPERILNGACIPAMSEVGRLFEEGEKYVPEMLISAKAMQAGMNLLKPHLVQAGVEAVGRIVLGTVSGDLHDIGKNLVRIMLEGAGFEVVDLGVDVAAESFVEAVEVHAPQIVAMSALLTTTMPSMAGVVRALEAAGMRDRIKVLVGGAPVTPDFADEIGADGYAADASSGARRAKELLGIV